MKIKHIKRFSFLVLLLLPFLVSVFATLWTIGDKSFGTFAEYDSHFVTVLKENLPDYSYNSYVFTAVKQCYTLLVGSSESLPIALYYISYGVNLLLIWFVVDCFVALPLILKRFIDRGVYREK